jgi:hypothetical protein
MSHLLLDASFQRLFYEKLPAKELLLCWRPFFVATKFEFLNHI